MKIERYYNNRESMAEMEEPYGDALAVLNMLYMKAPQGRKCLISKDVIDYYVMSFVRTAVENLTKEQYSFPSVFMSCWRSTCKNSPHEKMEFDDFCVNADYEHVAIWGPVYYVLTVQGNIEQVYLDYMEREICKDSRLTVYFSPFKDAALKAKEKASDTKEQKAKGLTVQQATLFCMAFLAKNNCEYSNKKKTIAPMVSQLFGHAVGTVERYGFTPTGEDRKVVAQIFEETYPEFSRYVSTFDNKYAAAENFSDAESASDGQNAAAKVTK